MNAQAKEQAHTAGPWVRNESEPFFVGADGSPVISTVTVGRYSDDCQHLSGPEQEANANLIGAAPDLLEALQLVWDTYGMDPSVDSSIWQTARAAIAKATGGQS